MKNIFKILLSILSGYLIWYLIISFLLWNYNISDWSWVARLFLFIFGTYSTTKILEE